MEKPKVVYPDYDKFLQHPGRALQLSFPRSGRNWISSIISQVARVKGVCVDLKGHANYNWESNALAYFTIHWRKELVTNDETRFILLLRDPRDSMVSLMDFNNDTKKVDWFNAFGKIQEWCNYWKVHLDTAITQNNYLIMQYEHALLYPAIAVHEILDFSDLPAINSIYDVIVKTDRRKFGKAMVNMERYYTQALRWRADKRFTKKHNDFIWDILGDTMEQYGYLKDKHFGKAFMKESIRCENGIVHR